ncbi:4-(cytidine 5'-diphospho)-2-C-methyl-D-erythritol kinase [Alkalicaulis satelles]|uniref:4-diphosphocytidyl-2-C-methyl-D-erythritol kinase n=1 Tax=Alkalicaulis satelles TaxID=2609175 RepID=A0A5M6ZSE1_9PROT|nr:4-(cytidine 5'-diphospho)-2-C-methyl-D-erythritol kinase [Alkalicaulis satelles]KAA5805231.1 4-(cytidine 5'-diphospho)-2-C-methyl-D-erythritol kinase [Alkalicaulis satelles]
MSLSMREGVEAFAPAKVNLTLRAGAARADGYHPLDSLVVFADWGDTVIAEPGEGLSLSIEGEGASALAGETQNLVLKAAWALRAAAGQRELGARLTLVKRLPVAAGLGGGSSDAAAALRALALLWELDFSLRQLAEIGSVVGADVPVCVHARASRMSGIGEQVAPLAAWPSLPALILHPGAALSTRDVFTAFDADNPAALAPGGLPAAGGLEGALRVLETSGNDLEAPALRLRPVIGEALALLREMPGARLARMSGSGASCFAIFETLDAAQHCAGLIQRARPDWTAAPVTFGGAA